MLPCGVCDERFSSNDELREHLEQHASQMFDSDEEIQENEIKTERESDEESLDFEYVKEEKQLPGQQEATQGEDDSEQFASVAPSEAANERIVHERESSETFMCSKCSFKTINKKTFKEHMNQMHLNKYKCDHCPKRFASEGCLVNHIRKEHKEDKDSTKLPEDELFRITKKEQGNPNRTFYECLNCTYKTPIRSSIYQHIRGVHKNLLDELYKSKGMVMDDAAYHKCTKCFFKTLKMDHLKQHIKRVHQKRRDFVCDLCNKAFFIKSDLIKHMKYIHISSESSELYKCSICTYKSIGKMNLKSHLNVVHLKIRKFTCDLCPMKTSSLDNLRQHIEKHHLEKNILSCNRGRNCSFRTKDRHELLRHVRRVHEKIQGFSCEICGKWYSSRNSLSKHKKTHLGRLTCDLCQFTTKHRSYMYAHMKKKHFKKN